jgi:hypothetical protein
VNENSNLEKILSDLLKEVQLLTVETKVTALEKFKSDYLTTDMRRQAYDAIDGEKTLQEISTSIGCKLNTLQIFAQTLVESDLVDVVNTKGRSRVLSKSVAKIAIYYAAKALEKGNE